MSDILKEAYSPERFRRQGHELIDFLADYMSRMQDPANEERVIRFRPADETLEDWSADLARNTKKEPIHLFQRGLEGSVKLLHPNYMGHQISPPAPLAALAGLFGDFVNNGMGVYEMGMAGTSTERVVIQTVAEQLGFPAEAGGFITSGGTLANLTALLAARSLRARGDIWKQGQKQQLALMVSEEAHYCVDRAARIMGWGEAGIIKIPVDDQYRMRADLLDPFYREAISAGKEVIAVVGSACTTATGSFDPLDAIAAFCQKNNLWFHVDGAHGAALAFSPKYAPILKGIDQADSVAMDFHKMLITPSITTALIFKKEENSYHTFSQQAQYLFNREEPEWYNLAKRTFECTKLMIGFKVYSIIRTYGTELFDEYVTSVCDLGRLLAQKIKWHDHLELAMEPSCNIVCFRYYATGKNVKQLNELNERIRQDLLEEGGFYIVQTRLGGALWLRCTLTNPFTEEKDLEALLQRILVMAG